MDAVALHNDVIGCCPSTCGTLMTEVTFDFDGVRGYRLSGRLLAPEAVPRAWAIFAHCFTCGKDSLAAARIARALASEGIGVLRFDFAGLGTSGGCFADSTFAANVDDVVAAGRAMTEAGKAPALLIGHSLGGAAALAAAASMPGIRAVATIGAPFDVKNVLKQFNPDSLEKIRSMGEAEVQLAGRPFVVRKTFVDDLERHDLASSIQQLGRALLVMHSPHDTTVDIDNAGRIFLAAKHPKSFISLDDADHLMRKSSDADYAAALIAAWVSHYLPGEG